MAAALHLISGDNPGDLGQLGGRVYLQQRLLNNGRNAWGIFQRHFLYRHLRDRTPSRIVRALSTRWQSWVGANFCFLLIKISRELTLWQEKIKNHDLCFTVVFCIILSMDELYFPKPPSPLTFFFFLNVLFCKAERGTLQYRSGWSLPVFTSHHENTDLLHGRPGEQSFTWLRSLKWAVA